VSRLAVTRALFVLGVDAEDLADDADFLQAIREA
jgi:hypothetical protein